MAFVVPEEALRGRTSGSHKLQPINARLINSLSTDAAAVTPSCFLHQHCTDMTINAMCNLPDTHVTRLLSVVYHGNMMTQCHSPGT
eukprot:scaffold6084_cov90-Skeletonema_marinoi.AAC.1